MIFTGQRRLIKGMRVLGVHGFKRLVGTGEFQFKIGDVQNTLDASK